jgi:hypothetical protein
MSQTASPKLNLQEADLMAEITDPYQMSDRVLFAG